MEIKKDYIYGFLIFMLLCFLVGCSESNTEYNNRYDPSSSSYIPPMATIMQGPDNNSTVNVSDVQFVWKGNDDKIEYSYQIDENVWSSWTTQTSFNCIQLDEGSHIFSVKGRYLERTSEGPISTKSFVVDAVKGPALMMKPRYIKVSSDKDSNFMVQFFAEEVKDLMLAHIVLTYDQAILTVVGDVESGDLLSSRGGNVFFKSKISSNKVVIDTGVGISNPSGINGSGSIAKLTFKYLKRGNTILKIADESKIRDSANNDIMLNKVINGTVEFQ
jgi:hypothetical protein